MELKSAENGFYPQLRLEPVAGRIDLFVPTDLRLRVGSVPFLEWTNEYRPSAEPLETCPESFLRLAEAGGDDVYAFAQRFGVLGISPTVRSLIDESEWTSRTDDHDGWNTEYGIPSFRYMEPTENFTYLARAFLTVLRLAADLYEGGEAQPADLSALSYLSAEAVCAFGGAQESNEATASLQRAIIASEITSWLEWSSACPVLTWDNPNELRVSFGLEDMRFDSQCRDWDIAHRDLYDAINGEDVVVTAGPSEHQRPSRLFTSLVFQLAASVTAATGLYRCYTCRMPFNPKNIRAHANKRRFCSDWCRKQGHLEVVHESYRRRKARRQGTNPNENS